MVETGGREGRAGASGFVPADARDPGSGCVGRVPARVFEVEFDGVRAIAFTGPKGLVLDRRSTMSAG
jgi:hypothetical protein